MRTSSQTEPKFLASYRDIGFPPSTATWITYPTGSDGLFHEHFRHMAAPGNLRRPRAQRGEPRRPSGRASGEIRARHQFEGCEGHWAFDFGVDAVARRQGHRMMGWMAPLRHLSAKLLSDRISSEWEPSMGEVLRSVWTWRSMFFRCT